MKTNSVICACFDITEKNIQEVISSNRNITFNELIDQTKAGSKCTACTLDLEYLYVGLTNTSNFRVISRPLDSAVIR